MDDGAAGGQALQDEKFLRDCEGTDEGRTKSMIEEVLNSGRIASTSTSSSEVRYMRDLRFSQSAYKMSRLHMTRNQRRSTAPIVRACVQIEH